MEIRKVSEDYKALEPFCAGHYVTLKIGNYQCVGTVRLLEDGVEFEDLDGDPWFFPRYVRDGDKPIVTDARALTYVPTLFTVLAPPENVMEIEKILAKAKKNNVVDEYWED